MSDDAKRWHWRFIPEVGEPIEWSDHYTRHKALFQSIIREKTGLKEYFTKSDFTQKDLEPRTWSVDYYKKISVGKLQLLKVTQTKTKIIKYKLKAPKP